MKRATIWVSQELIGQAPLIETWPWPEGTAFEHKGKNHVGDEVFWLTHPDFPDTPVGYAPPLISPLFGKRLVDDHYEPYFISWGLPDEPAPASVDAPA